MMKGERGFTIVEVIIAIMVLVVGLLGLVTALLLVLCSRSDVTAWAPVAQAASITTGEPALDGPLGRHKSGV